MEGPRTKLEDGPPLVRKVLARSGLAECQMVRAPLPRWAHREKKERTKLCSLSQEGTLPSREVKG